MTAFALSQILIGIVFVISAATFQFRRREHVLVCYVAVTILLSGHFWLLDTDTAALLAGIASVRYLIAIYSQSPGFLYLFLFSVLASAIATFSGPLSVLAGTGSVLTTVASFRGDQGLRQVGMLGSVVWIAHNALAGSPGAVALEVFFLLSNLVGYYRYYVRKKIEVAG